MSRVEVREPGCSPVLIAALTNAYTPFSICQHVTALNKVHTGLVLLHHFPCSKLWRKKGAVTVREEVR